MCIPTEQQMIPDYDMSQIGEGNSIREIALANQLNPQGVRRDQQNRDAYFDNSDQIFRPASMWASADAALSLFDPQYGLNGETPMDDIMSIARGNQEPAPNETQLQDLVHRFLAARTGM